ncbi:MAG TPA: FtsL-like putative cell division protein [Bacteroidales bacterium]|nr:FtsL-like putative cell division protein [Bacteroidales bacterium]
MAKDKSTSAKKNSAFLKELLSGTTVSEKIILNNLGYVALITFLLAFYIANRFHAEKIARESSRFTREVRDLRAEALSTSANLMYISRQSEVYKLVKEKGLDLEELKSPPYRLLVTKKHSEWQPSGTK